MSMKLKLAIVCVAVILACLVANRASAITYSWNNPMGGFFDFPGNWDPPVPPGPPGGMDEARFLISGGYEVTFTASVSTFNLDVSEGDVTFNLLDNTYDVFNAAVLGVGSPEPSSLTVNSGPLNIVGQFDILSGATLSGNQTGQVSASTVNVANGGALRGRLGVGTSSGFSNHGLIAPGDDGIGTIAITGGGLELLEDGTLEIEIRGSGMAPDVLVYDNFGLPGSAVLGGHLSVPFINGYVPQVNDSFTFLLMPPPGSSISGQFDSLSVPGLGSGLAARLDYSPQETSITFVAPLTVGFNSGNLAAVGNDWNDTDLWGGGTVPDSTSTVNVQNQQNFDARIQLVSTAPDAFTHQTTLSGVTNSMTLAVLEGADFTAGYRLNVNNRGVVELAGGTVHSNLVKVNPGGQLVGNGIIDGDLQLGTTTGSNQAILSPGFSSGEITIEDNLTIAQNGTVEIEIFADDDFDQVIVGQDANLGGTLMVDIDNATNPDDLLGTSFGVLSAADVNFEFNDVELMDDEDNYFVDVDYSGTEVALFLVGDGDMDYDDDYDSEDVRLFATGLTDPLGYFNEVFEAPEDGGDMNDDGKFDFDDITEFSQLDFADLTADEVVSYILGYNLVVPEPCTCVLIAVPWLLVGGFGRALRKRALSSP